MIKIGVQTKGILPEFEISKGLAMIKEAGFDCVDFNLDSFLTNTALYKGERNTFFDSTMEELTRYFGYYKSEMDRLGLFASQMHAPYPIWVDLKWEQNDYMEEVVIPKSILIAKTLGVPWIVIHPIKMQHLKGKEVEIEQNIECFKRITPLLKEAGVGMCVENLYEGLENRIIEGPCADVNEAIYYVDTMNDFAGEELFGICLDTGHLQLTKRNPIDYIHTAGKRIKILHLHENNAKSDMHQMPFTFGNSETDGLDWQGIVHALRDVGYEGVLNFETHPCMRSFPEMLLFPALKTIHGIGEYLRSEMETTD